MKGIYKIVNIINNKYYIGSTMCFEKRKKRHLRDLKNNKHHNIHLQRSWNKYGETNFKFIMILETENYKKEEQDLLNEMDWNNCYNISATASGGDLIKNHPNRDEIIKKTTSILLKSPKPKPKYRELNGNWKGGWKSFCKCGNKIAAINKTCSKCQDRTGKNNPFFGKTHSQETIKKIKDEKIGKYLGNQEKPVIIDNIEYKSLSAAARILNVTPSTIMNRIRNKKFINYDYK